MANESSNEPSRGVSAGNPCPFLRAAVAEGHLDGHAAAPLAIGDFVARAAGAPDAAARRRARLGTAAVALVGNGLWPWQTFGNAVRGTAIDELRDGPLDKHGAGSRILRSDATVDESELQRLATYGSEYRLADGEVVQALDAGEITAMMDANFERAAGHRRGIDRKLMDGEWPVLLSVIGRDTDDGRQVLVVADVVRLVTELRLPDHVEARLRG